jgi:hypothetical protein
MGFVIAGAVIVGGLGIAALYDYRVRRRGGRASVAPGDASSNPRNVEAALDPTRQDRLGGGGV